MTFKVNDNYYDRPHLSDSWAFVEFRARTERTDGRTDRQTNG